MENRLKRHLKKFKKRIFIRRLIRYLTMSYIISFSMILVFIIISKFYALFIKDILIFSCLIVPVLVSLSLAIINRPTDMQASIEADYNGLDEIVSSACEFSKSTEKTHIEEELYEKAIYKLETLESIDRVKLITNKKSLLILILLIGIILPINFIKTDISTSVESELKEIKEIEELEKEMEKKLEKVDNIKAKELLKELKETLKDIHNPEKIDEEIFKMKKVLNEEVKTNIKSKLSEIEDTVLSEKQKNDILSSDNSLQTLKDMIKDSEFNKNKDETDELKNLESELTDENIEESSEAIEKLEELKEKVDEHNESSESRASTWKGGSNSSSVGATNNLNKVLDKNASKSVNLSKESSSSSKSSAKTSSKGGSKESSKGANIVDNGDKEFEKLYESTFIKSEGDQSNLNSAYKDFEEYEKMKTLGLGDTEEASVLKNKIVESYINTQIDKSSEDQIPEALKVMIKEYYENIGDN